DVSWTLGGGGFTSNIQDLTGFVVGLANRRFVSRAIEAQMWEAQRLSNGMPTTYGLGFGVGKNQGRLHVSHSGAQKKTRTQFLLYPGEQRGVAVMTNSEWVQPAEYARGIMEALR
ncbi:MAG: beta-lactamase family protein, partial [Armatimonadetes bacterium]|nr:beta-lactamase family protein [Armatimonadota bacterium]